MLFRSRSMPPLHLSRSGSMTEIASDEVPNTSDTIFPKPIVVRHGDGLDESLSEEESELEAPDVDTKPEGDGADSDDDGVIEAPNWPIDDIFDPTDYGMDMSRRLLHWGPLLALTLIAIIGTCTTIVAANYAPPLDSLFGFINLAVFFYSNYSALTNFLEAVRHGGGYVKPGYTPPKEIRENLQFCMVCKGYKVPRSHHCSKCNRCVLKMDHHCPWLNSCVGHRNHAFFIKFIISAVLGSLHAMIFQVSIVSYTIYLHLYYPPSALRYAPITEVPIIITAMVGGALASGVAVATTPLLYFQLKVIQRNMTHIEDYICAKADVRHRKTPFKYPYDLGWKRNFIEVLFNGRYPNGNGIWWPIVKGCDQFTFSNEQIAQKLVKQRFAKIRTIAKDYDGGVCLGACRFGIAAFCCQSCADGRRIAVKVGDHVAVTRGNKRWVYAKKVEKRTFADNEGNIQVVYEATAHEARGWFPRECILTLAAAKAAEENEAEEKKER
uniref:Palmitoyltransferase n=2 Tax=Panagrellus redivivus TaxID=6233 RepID=A0A7E4V5Z1_PANRE